MLERLWIRNYALITDLTVEFPSGFSILTGETGAGKSILIGALGLVLGSKGDVGAIRTGADETSVAALVSVQLPQALQWLEDHEIETDDGAVLIKRSVKTSGRGSITIEDVPVTRKLLAEFASLLFAMHGQHDHQTLMNSRSQLRLLDAYGDLSDDVKSFAQLFSQFVEAKRSLNELETSRDHIEQEKDLLTFAIEEIEAAKLSNGEDDRIAEEINKLDQYEKLSESITQVRELLHPQQGSVADIRTAVRDLETAAGIDNSLMDLFERLSSARYELEDIFEEVRIKHEGLEFSPQRLDELNERMQEIRRLKKKYGPSIEEVLSYSREASERLDALDHRYEYLERAKKEVQELSTRVHREAERLSEKRRQVADRLSPQVMNHISKLGMPNARFFVQINPRTDAHGKSTCSAHGADSVTFMLSANLGEPPKPLSAVASGGELSRVMLALKSAAAGAEECETLIFDEIDAGIGGNVAVSVGEHLKKLASVRQVLCISHLASIAAKADAQIVVEKGEESDRTVTRVTAVTGEDRIRELARMLSGSSSEEKALEHARMLIKSR
jgi:DNA repair protein RecN (Recombination protein N)